MTAYGDPPCAPLTRFATDHEIARLRWEALRLTACGGIVGTVYDPAADTVHVLTVAPGNPQLEGQHGRLRWVALSGKFWAEHPTEAYDRAMVAAGLEGRRR